MGLGVIANKYLLSLTAKGMAVNGWYFWEYERALGDWMLLDELRH